MNGRQDPRPPARGVHEISTAFCLPDIGEGLHEAEVVAWHVGVGDHVVTDQPLVSVETDKAVVEIPSPRSGHVAALHAAVGDLVLVGAPLVDFEDAGPPDHGTVVGQIPEEPAPTPAPPPAPAGTGRATPAVRARARALGVDLAGVVPTGPGGAVTTADVDAAGSRSASSIALEPLRGVRRAMATNMARAHATIVPATVVDDADVSSWVAGADVLVRLIRAVAEACAAEPALNAGFLGPDVGRRANTTVDLGIAVDTPDGLFVPVLRDVGARVTADLRAEIDARREEIASRSIAAEHLRDPTITLSNFGSVAGRYAQLVIVPPQVAIIGAGRMHRGAAVRDGALVATTLLPLSLTFDHRVVTGGEAARFLAVLIDALERPDREVDPP